MVGKILSPACNTRQRVRRMPRMLDTASRNRLDWHWVRCFGAAFGRALDTPEPDCCGLGCASRRGSFRRLSSNVYHQRSINSFGVEVSKAHRRRWRRFAAGSSRGQAD